MGVDAGEDRRRSAYGARAKVDGGGGWVVPCASAGRGRIQRRRGHASCGREGGGVSPWSRVCRGEAAAAALTVGDPWAGAKGAREGAAAARLRDPWWGRGDAWGGESLRIRRLRDSKAYWTVEIVGRQNQAEAAYPLEP
jgi:hypothetical protein